MSLYQRFFEAARLDLGAAKVLTDRGLYQPAIYHLQQAYEKCIKSYFIFKEVNINHTPEADVYNTIRIRLGHDTEESTIVLLKDLVDIERGANERKIPTTTNPNKIQALKNSITVIDNYKASLDRLVKRLDLRVRYITNVRNYSQYDRLRYNDHQTLINAITTQPDMNFHYTLLCMANLYPCLYKMESVTRYPLTEFGYDNLNLLNNQRESCQRIVELLSDLIRLTANNLA